MKRSIALAVLLLGGCGAAPSTAPLSIAEPDGVPLGALPKQALGAGECGLFLWKTGTGARLVLVAKSGPPPFARILLDGRTLDLPRVGEAPAAADANARYGDGRVAAALDLIVERREGLIDGAVARGSVRIEREGGDGFVVPVSGLLACA